VSVTLKFFLYTLGIFAALLFGTLILPVAASYYYLGSILKCELMKNYAFNLAIAVDQLANSFVLGSTRETISGRVNRALHSETPQWFVAGFGRFVDWLAVLVARDHNHIRKSDIITDFQDELDSWIKKI